MNTHDPTVRMGLSVPTSVRQWLRLKAVQTDTTMTQLVADILQQYIDNAKEDEQKAQQ